ncbi:MAG: hypothetical protein AVDCRST_MAG91-2428 [uncultured Sphingomonadaceae bacterium]|uniref:Uncharacterized protein n=1 Tax=uncultured Sphingomonadaceae bacterium TaxID=169976 RepID=A0A6J4TJ81_9SPHN|nr:MAG: hypothetical protein AVDCRST_MAG91-2428 [uncultured Sphingomonadaceae bacterium]
MCPTPATVLAIYAWIRLPVLTGSVWTVMHGIPIEDGSCSQAPAKPVSRASPSEAPAAWAPS